MAAGGILRLTASIRVPNETHPGTPVCHPNDEYRPQRAPLSGTENPSAHEQEGNNRRPFDLLRWAMIIKCWAAQQTH